MRYGIIAALFVLAAGTVVASEPAKDVPAEMGEVDVNVTYKDVTGTPRPLGPVNLFLYCKNVKSFSSRLHVGKTGHVEIAAPSGDCILDSASPVLLGGKYYSWRETVTVSSGQTATVDLSMDNALNWSGEDAPSATGPPIVLSTVEPRSGHPTPTPDGVVLPEIVSKINPEYPAAARNDRIEGKVICQGVVGVDGRVRDVKVVSSSNPIFDDSAVQAISQWRYLPARSAGKPVAVQYMVRTDFTLR